MGANNGTENFTDFQERIRELRLIIKSCERHGNQTDEQVSRLKKVVTGMEEVLKKSLCGDNPGLGV